MVVYRKTRHWRVSYNLLSLFAVIAVVCGLLVIASPENVPRESFVGTWSCGCHIAHDRDSEAYQKGEVGQAMSGNSCSSRVSVKLNDDGTADVDIWRNERHRYYVRNRVEYAGLSWRLTQANVLKKYYTIEIGDLAVLTQAVGDSNHMSMITVGDESLEFELVRRTSADESEGVFDKLEESLSTFENASLGWYEGYSSPFIKVEDVNLALSLDDVIEVIALLRFSPVWRSPKVETADVIVSPPVPHNCWIKAVNRDGDNWSISFNDDFTLAQVMSFPKEDGNFKVPAMALLRTEDSAFELSKFVISIGKRNGLRVRE